MATSAVQSAALRPRAATFILLTAIAALLLGAGYGDARGKRRHSFHGMRRQELHVYFHDRLNVTDVLVAEHAPGPITQTAAPYGSLFCVNDHMTVTRDPDSALLGHVTGLSTTASFDGVTYFCTFTVSFNTTKPQPGTPAHLSGLDGTINIFGLVNVIEPKPHAISGGTGSFLMAQGTATIVPIDVRTFKQIYRLDLDIYMPA
ncbi:hypothetical protein KP509_30G058500 [Ceratopteris richardii]|uniref:Dirigent protein n=2 Tax=Ceratopteris richardii TaxID=49495 RepID=A0A8T2R4Z9_CERRI|nr:hypothetical protein KP509_30G058500 [Ceratopteris richardii]